MRLHVPDHLNCITSVLAPNMCTVWHMMYLCIFYHTHCSSRVAKFQAQT